MMPRFPWSAMLVIGASMGCATPSGGGHVAAETPTVIRCPENTSWDGAVCVGAIACPEGTAWDGKVCMGSAQSAGERTVAEPATMVANETAATRPEREPHPKESAAHDRVQQVLGADGSDLGRIDIFLQSDVEGGWARIDGFPAPAPPGKTFILEPGDHVIDIGASGFPSCRFAVRGLKAGESLTLKALLTTADEHGCGLIARRDRLGQMASF